MSGRSDYLFFYSPRCQHSKQLLSLFERDSELERLFVKVNVENKGIKIPKCVTKVPSVIIPFRGRPSLLTGKTNILQWYQDLRNPSNRNSQQQQPQQQQQQFQPQQQQQQYQPQQQQEQMKSSQQITDYDPITMNGYSDTFSFINNDNPQRKSFAFLTENGYDNSVSSHVSTQPSGTVSSVVGQVMNAMGFGGSNSNEEAPTNSRESQKRRAFDQQMERYMSQRNNEIPQGPVRIGGGR